MLQRLERAIKTLAKRKADIAFLQKCLICHLTPVILRFKLYNKNLRKNRRVQSFRRSLLIKEISQQRKYLQRLNFEIK